MSGSNKKINEKGEGMGERSLGRRKEMRGWRQEKQIWNKGKKKGWKKKGDKYFPTDYIC